MDTLPSNVIDFLKLVAISSGAIVSWLSENWTWFAALSSQQKLLVQAGLSVAASLIGTLLTSLATPGTIDHINAVYVIIIQIVIALVANQVFHLVGHKVIKPVAKAVDNRMTAKG